MGECRSKIFFFTLPGDLSKYEDAAVALTNYFQPSSNVPYERHVFRSTEQRESETIEQYVTRLRQKAETCEFNDVEQQIRDQVIEKCSSNILRQKFLERGKDLTLTILREIARAYGTSAAQVANFSNPESLHNKPERDGEIHRLARKGSRPRSSFGSKFNDQLKCYRCGNSGHQAKDLNCPARGRECLKCKKVGHYARCCKTKSVSSDNVQERYKQPKVRQLTNPVLPEEQDSDFLFALSKKTQIEKCSVTIGGVKIDVVIDSGASCNIIDRHMWEHLKQNAVRCKCYFTEKKIYAYASEEPLKLAGGFKADVGVSNALVKEVDFLVMEGKGEPILGKETALALGILKIEPSINTLIDESQNSDNGVNEILKRYNTVFEGVGKLKNFQLKIPLDTSVEAVCQNVRRIPYHLREKLSTKLKELEKLGIVEKTSGPTKWASPVIVVPKPDDDIRLCVDMRRANLAVKRERYPIPTIEELLQEMNQSKIFSKLDVKWAYHQIELEPESRDITTFVTHEELYRYKRLMFGISCAPEM